jgi:acylphosphatase
MSTAPVIRHVVIRGRVQGVGFRMWTEDTALQHGVAGFVRNRRDGCVEAVFAGSADAVAAMIEACQHGPAGARVDGVTEQQGGPDLLAARHPGERFSVLPTA